MAIGLAARGVALVGSKLLRNKRIASTVKTGAAVAAGAAAGLVAANFNSSNLGTPASADPYKGASTWFPMELEEIDHWVEFTAEQTTGRGLDLINSFLGSSLSIGSSSVGGTIRLPMPSNLSTDYNPEYSTPELGPVAGMALKPIEQGMYGLNSMSAGSTQGQGQSGLTAGSYAAGAALGGAVGVAQAAAGRLGIGGDAFGAALKVGAGVAVNQHKIVLFTGVGFRDHQFSWKLSPKNREESNRIKGIIDQFAYYSHPQYIQGGLFFKYPEFFRIKFRHPQYLFELLPSVCTDVRVNYHGQGYAGYIRDSDGGGPPAPAEVEISLTFKEVEIVTKDTLQKELNTAGTFRSTPTRTPGNGG